MNNYITQKIQIQIDFSNGGLYFLITDIFNIYLSDRLLINNPLIYSLADKASSTSLIPYNTSFCKIKIIHKTLKISRSIK